MQESEYRKYRLILILVAQLMLYAACKTDRTPLMIAAQKGQVSTVKSLLAVGADVNAKDSNGNTALMFAATSGSVDTVQVLMHSGADVDMKNNDGKMALMLAAYSGYADTVRALLAKGANMDAKDNSGNTALLYAKKAGHNYIVDLLKAAFQESQADNIREVVFRYQIEQWEKIVKQFAQARLTVPHNVYFLDLGTGDVGSKYIDPSDEFMSRFQGNSFSVKRVSSSRVERDRIKDISTGETGIVLRTHNIKWVSEVEVEIVGEFCGYSPPLFCTYRVKRENGHWVVKEEKIISPEIQI